MNSKNSFTYVISSDERTNAGANQITYDIDFGGFSGKNQNYNCEVLSFSINGRTTTTPENTGYFLFMCENLNDDGFFAQEGICIGMKDKKYLTISPKGFIKIKEFDNWGEGFQIRCVKLNEKFVNETAEASISTITINEKTWMTQNLRAKTFQNGDSILFISNSKDWETVNTKSIPAYCFKDFDSLNEYEHGFYYNYSAILDSRKLAPKGWRLNTKEDWEALQKSYHDTISFVQAIVSDKYYPDGNNSSGLNLMPESRVNLYGMFTGVSLIWCPSKDFSTNTFYYSSTFQFLGGTSFSYSQENYASGLPVRCIKED